MALNRIKVWVAEVLGHVDLNAEFQNIVDYINTDVLGATSHVHDGADAAQVSYLNLLDHPTDNNAFCFPVTGTLVAGNDAAPLKHEMWEAGTVVEARAVCKTAPTGAKIIIDLNDDGTTILGATKLEIAIGATSGSTTTITNPSVAKGSVLTMDLDQVGNTIAGADLTVYLIYQTDL